VSPISHDGRETHGRRRRKTHIGQIGHFRCGILQGQPSAGISTGESRRLTVGKMSCLELAHVRVKPMRRTRNFLLPILKACDCFANAFFCSSVVRTAPAVLLLYQLC
jgi:hypothetical protein